MAKVHLVETVTLNRETFQSLMTAVEFYIDTMEQATGQLTWAFNKVNLEHDVRFLLNDAHASGLQIKRLLEKAQQE